MREYSIQQIIALLSERMPDLVGHLGLTGGKAYRDGKDLVCLNPGRPDKHVGSFRVSLTGAHAGWWYDFSGAVGGDALELISMALHVDKVDAIKWARSYLGLDGDHPPPAPVVALRSIVEEDKAEQYRKFWADPENAEKYRKYAMKIWLQGQNGSLRGTPVDGYLAARGINLSLLGKSPRALRYAPALGYYESRDDKKVLIGNFPAMVALAQGPDGFARSVHRTYLENVNGIWAKRNLQSNKKMSSTYGGAFIPIWRGKSKQSFAAMTTPERVYVTEGIEDALTVAVNVPEYRVICGISVSNIRNILFPEAVLEIVVCADNDAADSMAARQLDITVETLKTRGHAVLIARSSVGKDFNDWQKQGQSNG